MKRETCKACGHVLAVVKFCPACRGGKRSKAKARASRENGKLGGRPPGKRKLR